jgi:hypothetical protein
VTSEGKPPTRPLIRPLAAGDVPFTSASKREDVLLKLQKVNLELTELAREEPDADWQAILIKGATVLETLSTGLRGGYTTEMVDPLWRTAQQTRGGSNVVLTKNRKDMEDAYAMLRERVAKVIDGQNFENVVENVLLWIRWMSPMAPAPTDDRFAAAYWSVLADRGLRSKDQRKDAGAIVRACLRACGYGVQVGKRDHMRDHRRVAKKRASKTRK